MADEKQTVQMLSLYLSSMQVASLYGMACILQPLHPNYTVTPKRKSRYPASVLLIFYNVHRYN